MSLKGAVAATCLSEFCIARLWHKHGLVSVFKLLCRTVFCFKETFTLSAFLARGSLERSCASLWERVSGGIGCVTLSYAAMAALSGWEIALGMNITIYSLLFRHAKWWVVM